jgi:hypothetical protein
VKIDGVVRVRDTLETGGNADVDGDVETA